jgi:hypothetical protein
MVDFDGKRGMFEQGACYRAALVLTFRWQLLAVDLQVQAGRRVRAVTPMVTWSMGAGSIGAMDEDSKMEKREIKEEKGPEFSLVGGNSFILPVPPTFLVRPHCALYDPRNPRSRKLAPSFLTDEANNLRHPSERASNQPSPCGKSPSSPLRILSSLGELRLQTLVDASSPGVDVVGI